MHNGASLNEVGACCLCASAGALQLHTLATRTSSVDLEWPMHCWLQRPCVLCSHVRLCHPPAKFATCNGFMSLDHTITAGPSVWFAVDGQVYDVTDYTSLHPGGKVRSRSLQSRAGCGGDANVFVF